MKAKNIMTENVCCVGNSQSLKDAAQIMWEHNCGSVPVVNEANETVGMITDRDIAMAAYINGNSLDNISVSTAQSSQLTCCGVNDDISKVESMMQVHQVHRIPVLGKQREPVGIISLNDIARAYKAGTKGITAQDVSDTLAAICSPTQENQPISAVVAL